MVPIAVGKQGGTIASVASKIGVAKSTIQLWAKEHSEFSAAMDLGKVHAEHYLVKLALERCKGANQGGSDNMLKWLLACAHGWRDKEPDTNVTLTLKNDIDFSTLKPGDAPGGDSVS